jgi:hypothetical protein
MPFIALLVGCQDKPDNNMASIALLEKRYYLALERQHFSSNASIGWGLDSVLSKRYVWILEY